MKRSLYSLLSVLAAVGVFLFWAFLRPPLAARSPEVAREAYDPLTTRPSDEGDSGERTYFRYCSGCHGVSGDGAGPAARLLDPKPRDFTQGIYKFQSTPSGAPPLAEDLERTITYGLKGTSMPGWRFLPLQDRQAVVRYILRFNKHQDESYPEPAIPFHDNPFDVTDEFSVAQAVELGRKLYHETATCWQCHPGYMERAELETLIGSAARANLSVAEGKEDRWGQVILPTDFPRTPMKSVRNLTDLYRVITAGVGGTAMPTWKDAFNAEQLWALTIYVDSISRDSLLRQRRDS